MHHARNNLIARLFGFIKFSAFTAADTITLRARVLIIADVVYLFVICHYAELITKIARCFIRVLRSLHKYLHFIL